MNEGGRGEKVYQNPERVGAEVVEETPRQETWPLAEKSSHCQPVAELRGK